MPRDDPEISGPREGVESARAGYQAPVPLRLRLDAVPDSGATARRAIATWLASHHLAARVDDVSLLTSELVTNALRHGVGPLDLTVTRMGDRLRVAVADHGDGAPEPRAAAPDDPGGRGLAIVAALALRWGVDPVPTSETDPAGSDDRDGTSGKVVWAEVDLGAASPG